MVKWPPHTDPRAALERIVAANAALLEAARALGAAFDDAPSEIANGIQIPIYDAADAPGGDSPTHRAFDALDFVLRLVDLTSQATTRHLDSVVTETAVTTTAPGSANTKE